MIVMHPLPRVGEIDPRIDSGPRAYYFNQVRNGLFMRMALLSMILKPPTYHGGYKVLKQGV